MLLLALALIARVAAGQECGFSWTDAKGDFWTVDLAALAGRVFRFTASEGHWEYYAAPCGGGTPPCVPAYCNATDDGTACALLPRPTDSPTGVAAQFSTVPPQVPRDCAADPTVACTSACNVLAPQGAGGATWARAPAWSAMAPNAAGYVAEYAQGTPGWWWVPPPEGGVPSRRSCDGGAARTLAITHACDEALAPTEATLGLDGSDIYADVGSGDVPVTPGDQSGDGCAVHLLLRSRAACFSFVWNASEWSECTPSAPVGPVGDRDDLDSAADDDDDGTDDDGGGAAGGGMGAAQGLAQSYVRTRSVWCEEIAGRSSSRDPALCTASQRLVDSMPCVPVGPADSGGSGRLAGWPMLLLVLGVGLVAAASATGAISAPSRRHLVAISAPSRHDLEAISARRPGVIQASSRRHLGAHLRRDPPLLNLRRMGARLSAPREPRPHRAASTARDDTVRGPLAGRNGDAAAWL